jgi:putative PIN family toxin of toxin-antitoxin system
LSILNSRVVSGEFRMIISLEILAELTGVLSSKKFNYPPEIVPNIINEIESVSEIVAPVQRITVSETDPYDNMILECALEARADYIISGDVHLPELLEFDKMNSIKLKLPAPRCRESSMQGKCPLIVVRSLTHAASCGEFARCPC